MPLGRNGWLPLERMALFDAMHCSLCIKRVKNRCRSFSQLENDEEEESITYYKCVHGKQIPPLGMIQRYFEQKLYDMRARYFWIPGHKRIEYESKHIILVRSLDTI